MKNRNLKTGAIIAVIVVVVLVLVLIILEPFASGKKGHYTYRYADDTPENFSPLSWSTDAERDILSYTTSGLYMLAGETADSTAEERVDDATESVEGAADAGSATEIADGAGDAADAETEAEESAGDAGGAAEAAEVHYEPLLAASMPEDVTADYAGNETYGIAEDATEGYAYRITLREDAVWSDGTAITTADFEYTLQLYLDEVCSHKSDYFNSYAALANAREYLEDAYVCAYDSDDGYADVEDSALYFSMTQTNALFKTCSLQEYYAYYSQDKAALFIDDDNMNIYEALESLVGDEEYVPLTNDIKELLVSLCKNYGVSNEEAYKRLCFYQDEENAITWESIGFVVEDDYTMTFILAKQVSQEELMSGLSDLLLVQKDTYEADPDAYGTSAEQYVSYGPYVIASYDEDGMVLEANESWFGYTDDALVGLYQTTDIEISYGVSNEDAEEAFVEGKLDVLNLGENAGSAYADSTYASVYSDTATVMLSINTDTNSLADISVDGENHTILAYRDFRHAISLAIDRDSYVESVNPAGTAAYGLFHSAYIADLSQMLFYRDGTDAVDVLESIYGEADENGAISYYNVEKAAELLQAAYDACLMDGNIKSSDQVVIYCYFEQEGLTDILQDALSEASVGTSLEGRITIAVVDDIAEADVWDETVVGDTLDVYASLEKYLDPEYADADGFCMGLQKRTITIDGEDVSMTYAQWYQELMNGEYADASREVQAVIVAALEKGLLTTYKDIPLYDVCETIVYSQRIKLGTSLYAGMQGDVIRYMTYSMDDRDWTKYCRKAKNQLDYQ